MRISLFLLSLIIIVDLIVGCKSNITNKSETVDYNTIIRDIKQESNDIDTSYQIDLLKLNDSTVLNNKYYKIIIVPHKGEVGDLIGIYNKSKQKSFSIDKGDSYYVAVVDSFLIVDSGTTNSRGLSIYDLNNLRKIFSGNYEGDLKLDGGLIKFRTAIIISDSTKIPKCSEDFKDIHEGLGYVETQIFDLKTLKLEKTGNYECCYFE